MFRILFVIFLFSSTALAAEVSPALEKKCREQFYKQNIAAADTCREILETNNTEMMKLLGDMFFWGWGENWPQDYKQAVRLYKRAASRGNVEAKFAVGVMYYEGRGLPIDYSLAFRWFLSASQDGHPEAQMNLANMYNKGAGVSPNEAEAFDWYLRAANQGVPEAMYNVGNRYARGLGTQANLIEAYRWHRLAENNGIQESAATLKTLSENMTASDLAHSSQLIQNWKPVNEQENLSKNN